MIRVSVQYRVNQGSRIELNTRTVVTEITVLLAVGAMVVVHTLQESRSCWQLRALNKNTIHKFISK